MSGPGAPASAPVLAEPVRRSDVAEDTCSIDGCTNSVLNKKRGWCNAHYQRWRKTGDPLKIRPGRWDGYVRPTCSVPDCEAPAHARGLCSVHSPRQRRHGDPLGGRRRLATGTIEERFRSFVDVIDSCWVWNGGTTTAGYGEFTIDGTTHYAHRYGYELFVGPVPDGMHLHHKCEVKVCCNPAHLTPLTAAEHRRLHNRASR